MQVTALTCTLVACKESTPPDVALPRGDLSISARATQGVQDAAGSIPIIASGGAVAVQVVALSTAKTSMSSKVVLRLTNAAGALVFADTETVNAPAASSGTAIASPVHFLVPANHVQSGNRWQVLRDPAGEAPDDTSSNDQFPRGGPALLATATVPALNIRFVPITLTAHGNHTAVVTDVAGYLRTALSSLPFGAVNATVATEFTTDASFGTPPSGGGQGFWVQVLQELDAARVASPDPTTHWYGVVSPPSQFNFTQFGGFGYIPSNPAAAGAGTRTALGVRTGWFFNQTQARDLVAHELAHNFGRRHSPCGGPGSLDASYPRPDGRLGEAMHDVYAWANGMTSTLQQVPAETGDLMGYCFPAWSSAYTYRAVMDFRGSTIAASAENMRTTPPEDVIVVQGSIARTGTIRLESPLLLRGYRTPFETGGTHRLQGLDENGSVVFEQAVHPAEVDHADVRLFTVALPAGAMRRATGIRVVTPRASATLAASTTEVAPDVRASGDDAIVGCGVAGARVAVQDAATGAVLGIGRGSLRIARARGSQLRVSCANGALPRRAVVRPG